MKTKQFSNHDAGMNNAVVWVQEEVGPLVSANTLIDAGHFLLKVNEAGHVTNTPDELTTLGFRMGVSLKQKATKKPNVVLSFLVGDFAFPEALRKTVKQHFALPQAYQTIIKQADMLEKDVQKFFESKLRNRALRNAKQFIKQSFIKKLGDIFRLQPEKTGIADVVGKTVGNVCVPLCRLMLAQKLADEEKMGFERVINIYDERMYMCRGNFAPVYYALYKGKLKEVINIYILPEESGFFGVEIRHFSPSSAQQEARGLVDKEIQEYGKK